MFILKALPLRAMRLPGFSNRRPGGILYEFAFKMHPKRWICARLEGLYQSGESIGLSLVGWVKQSVTHRITSLADKNTEQTPGSFARLPDGHHHPGSNMVRGIIVTRPFYMDSQPANSKEPMKASPVPAGRVSGCAGIPDPASLQDFDLLNECIENFGDSSVLTIAYCVYKASLMYEWKKWNDLRRIFEGS